METMSFGIAWTISWTLAAVSPSLISRRRSRVAWLFPVLGLLLLAVFRDAPPALRLLASSLCFLYLIKASVEWVQPALRLKGWDRLIYTTIWPGMDPERVAERSEAPEETGARFARGLWTTLFGIGSVGALALVEPYLSREAVGWLGIAGLLTTIHFGLSNLLTACMWLLGRPVHPLFESPLRSRSLSDFWTRRWNRPFVDMNRRLFLPALNRILPLRASVFAVFLVSGLLHEMAISYPAGAGWGGPLLYFLLQGVAVLVERRFRLQSRTLTWLIVLAPLPLLFNEPFRQTLIVPLFAWLGGLLRSRTLEFYMHLVLWSLGPMQLSVLMASAQVPRRLNWHEELPRLSPFNRKLMWTYALFIVATVIAFAVLTLALHESFMRGETAAIGLAGFMCGFWCLRLAFDTFYYKSEDWPTGVQFKVGHALLNALFIYLALGYGSTALWGWLRLHRMV